jgi:uncharacterized HAD superfamily protein
VQIIIDLDGTICSEEKTYSRSLAHPLRGAKETVNGFFRAGHKIIIYTSRSWQEYEMTELWLKKHGFRYHQLILGKPTGELWIDDRALRFTDWKRVSKAVKARGIPIR